MADPELKFKIGGDATGLVNQVGLSQQAIEKLAQSTGMSAKQINASLRGVPAQFTDIFTALASGQAPLTVLIQQGGQLKDMFGGAGPAARVLGGYIAGLINPVTLAAGAVGALALAYHKGAAESQRLSNALILSGNALGTTTGQLYAQAEAISAVTGATKGAAVETLTDLIQSSRISQESLQAVGTAVTAMHRATGRSVAEMAKEYDALAKTPVEALLKLNEQSGFLTAAVYQQVKAFQDQGRAAEAAALAQQTWASAQSDMAAKVVDNLGYLEKAINATGGAAKSMWDAMWDVGRETTLEERLAEVSNKIAVAPKINAAAAWGATRDRIDVSSLEKQKSALEAVIAGTKQAATYFKAQSDAEQAAIGSAKEYGELKIKYRTQEQQLADQIDRITKSSASAEEKIAWIAQARAASRGKEAKEAEKLAASIAAMRREELARMFKEAGAELAAMSKATAEWQKAQDALVEPLERQAEALAREVEFYGLAESAIQKILIARLEERKATLAQQEGMAGLVTELEREIEVRKRIAESAGDKEFLEANKEAMKAADRAAKEAAKDWQQAADKISDSITDSLMRGFESGKGFAENLRDSIKNMFSTLVLRPIVQAVVVGGMSASGMGGASGGGAGGGNNIMSTGMSLYNNWDLLSQFGGGTMSGANAAGTYFANATGSGLDGLLATNGAYGTAGGGGLGTIGAIGSTLGGMAAGYTLGQKYGIGGGLVGGLGSTALAGGLSSMAAGGGFVAGVAAIPVYGWIAAAVAAIAGSMAKGGTPHAGGITFSDGTNVTNPRGWAAIQGEYADPADAGNFGESDWTKRYNQSTADALAPAATGIAKILNAAATTFGGEAGYKVGLAFSADGEDRSRGRYSILNAAGDEVYDWGARKFAKDASKGIEEFISATGAGVVDVLNQMDLPDWAAGLLDDLGDTADVESVTAVVQQMQAIQAAAEKLAPALEMTENDFAAIYLQAGDAAMTAYYGLIADQSEQLADAYRIVSTAFDDLGFAIPSSIDGFRELITSLDETTEEGQETIAALFGLSSAFGSVQGAIDALESGVDNATLSLRNSEEQQAILTRRLADASAEAGVAIPGTVAELLRLADSIDYTTEAGMRLASALPSLVAAFNAAQSASILETQASRIDAYLQAQRAAELQSIGLQQDAYAAQVSTARDIATTFERILASLEDYRRSLLQSDASPLSPEQRYAEAARQFSLTAAKAKLGDSAAADTLPSVIDDFLAASKAISKTSEEYAVDFGKSLAALDGVMGTASNQAALANQQLAIAQAQLDALNTIAASLGASGSGGTPADLPLVVENYTQAMTDWQNWFATTAIGQTDSYDIGSSTRISNDKGLFTDAAGQSYVFSLAEGPYGLADQSSAWAAEMIKRYGQWKTPGFAEGGYHTGGWRVVGERGPELEYTGSSRIFSNSQSQSLIDLSQLIKAIDVLRGDMRTGHAVLSSNGNKVLVLLDRVSQGGTAFQVKAA